MSNFIFVVMVASSSLSVIPQNTQTFKPEFKDGYSEVENCMTTSIRYSAVVLAAGTSSRMHGQHKMLLPLGKESVIHRTVRILLDAQPQEVVVVTGFNAKAVTQALLDLPVAFQPNLRYEEGQMTSVTAGLGALRLATDVVMVCLGDMVLLTANDYRELIDAYVSTSRLIVVPHYQGRRGNPMVFAASYAPTVMSGQRKIGCRKLVTDYPEDVFAYEATHDRFVADMDTPEDYARILNVLKLSGASLTNGETHG